MVYYFRQRLPILLTVAFLFLLGVAFGSIAVRTLSQTQASDLRAYLDQFFASFPQELATTNRQAVAWRGVVDNIIKISGLVWVLGMTIIGVPLIFGIVFVRGFVLGFTVGFIISEMKLDGIVVATASLLPHNILLVPALILASTTAISFAVAAVQTLMGTAKNNIINQFMATTIIIAAASGLLALASLVEMYITPVLMQLSRKLIL
ncbi:MAG TPA: stage II sporulation protein M [Firmicutes bacterium]|nr:stage II sporulation protein M [Bacillota bacterium]